MEGDAVDTGPGLEAQESWDYSHSPVLTDALAAMEAHAGRKSRPGSGPPALQRLNRGECLSAAAASKCLLVRSAFTAWSVFWTTFRNAPQSSYCRTAVAPIKPLQSNHSQQSNELHENHVVSRQHLLLLFPWRQGCTSVSLLPRLSLNAWYYPRRMRAGGKRCRQRTDGP